MNSLTWPHIIFIVLLITITLAIIFYPQTPKQETFCQSTFIDTPIPTKPMTLPTTTLPPITDVEPKNELVLYYAMWCGNCKNFIPTWSKFEAWAKDNLKNVRINSVRCEDGNEAVCSQKGIKGYPTVMLYLKDGSEYMFEGPRTVEGLTKFVNDYAK
jgi:thiol-disulfide isomerase/thioredoxin